MFLKNMRGGPAPIGAVDAVGGDAGDHGDNHHRTDHPHDSGDCTRHPGFAPSVARE